MRISPVHSAREAISSFLSATSSTTFNADVGQQSGRSSRPFWYFLRGALSNYTAMHSSPLVHYSLATRLAETKNRPSGFDYLRLILALGVIWSHSRLLTNDWGNISPFFAHISAPFVAFLLPMFFALSGFLVAGSLERSNTLVTFLASSFPHNAGPYCGSTPIGTCSWPPVDNNAVTALFFVSKIWIVFSQRVRRHSLLFARRFFLKSCYGGKWSALDGSLGACLLYRVGYTGYYRCFSEETLACVIARWAICDPDWARYNQDQS
jgi:hypothetical protein